MLLPSYPAQEAVRDFLKLTFDPGMPLEAVLTWKIGPNHTGDFSCMKSQAYMKAAVVAIQSAVFQLVCKLARSPYKNPEPGAR